MRGTMVITYCQPEDCNLENFCIHCTIFLLHKKYALSLHPLLHTLGYPLGKRFFENVQ